MPALPRPGTGHIEAVYTFPLPVDAVLLRFSVEIGDRTMAGTVIAKTEAERRYEDAITDGDAAVLLEQPHLVRLAMPTTIAPRYGDPSAGGLEPDQEPEFAFDAERSFRLRVAVSGVLQGARWASPSHDIAVTPDRERTVIEIARPAAMDRDCVLEARAASADSRGCSTATAETGWSWRASGPRFPTWARAARTAASRSSWTAPAR